MSDSIFSQIIAGYIPGHIIYEDDNTVAFLDINPVNPGHTLVVPKKESATFADADPKDLNAMINTAQKIAKALLKLEDVVGVNIMCNNGKAAGQAVFHTHFHVIPRYENDGYDIWHGKPYHSGEAEKIREQIMEKLK
jgi:histidine triad (HIT) family protein